MLQEQIKALDDKIGCAMLELEIAEDRTKKAKSDIAVLKRAKQSLERLEEQLNGQADISE